MADIDVTGRLPELVVIRNKSHIVIKCEIVDLSASGPQPSGRTIHLGLTAEDAMRLLTLLKAAILVTIFSSVVISGLEPCSGRLLQIHVQPAPTFLMEANAPPPHQAAFATDALFIACK